MSKLISDCVESILEMAHRNELSRVQLGEIFDEALGAFDETAIIPRNRKLSRSDRESLGAEG